MITVYHYAACGTCKKAIAWLKAKGVAMKLVPIVEEPPTKATLKKVLSATGLPVSKLFNTSGQLYREGNYKEKLMAMSDDEALSELAAHGKLIKRPVIIGTSDKGPVHLVGFKEADYKAAF
jgi:arsenate reductase (glutaredoxin)